MTTWQDIKRDVKYDFVHSLQIYRKKGYDACKLKKMYRDDIKKINVHIANSDKLNIN